MKKFIQLVSLVMFTGFAPASLAVTEYVTDQIEIEVYQQPDVNSTVIMRLSTGDSVEVLQQHNNFKRVQLSTGAQGWINAGFLSESPPGNSDYEQLLSKNEELNKTLEEKNAQLAKLQRDLQVRRDQLSNAESTIKELKGAANADSGGDSADPELQKQLSEKEEQITQLQSEIESLKEQADNGDAPTPGIEQYKSQLAQQKEINKQLQARIDLAQNLLGRDQLPSAEELDKWQVSLPGWYWGTLLTVLIIGVVAGIGWMDYRLRRRHGGFRI